MRSGLCSGAAGGVASRSVRSVKGLLWGCGFPCAEAVGGGVERLGVSIRVSWQDHSFWGVCFDRSGVDVDVKTFGTPILDDGSSVCGKCEWRAKSAMCR